MLKDNMPILTLSTRSIPNILTSYVLYGSATIYILFIHGFWFLLQISQYEGKGRGIEATIKFYKGDFIVEYAGELIELKEAKSREEIYKRDTSYGCYMYFFNHKGKSYW